MCMFKATRRTCLFRLELVRAMRGVPCYDVKSSSCGLANLKNASPALAFNEYFIDMSLLCSAYTCAQRIPALAQLSTISRESCLASQTIDPSRPDPLILASGK